MITNLNTIVSAFHDWLQWNGIMWLAICCYYADHSQLSQAQSFIKCGWLLSCVMERDSFIHLMYSMFPKSVFILLRKFSCFLCILRLFYTLLMLCNKLLEPNRRCTLNVTVVSVDSHSNKALRTQKTWILSDTNVRNLSCNKILIISVVSTYTSGHSYN